MKRKSLESLRYIALMNKLNRIERMLKEAVDSGIPAAVGEMLLYALNSEDGDNGTARINQKRKGTQALYEQGQVQTREHDEPERSSGVGAQKIP